MKLRTLVFLLATHAVAVAVGFAAGIYVLPILTAPPAPTEAEVKEVSAKANYTAVFKRDLKDSDAFHWGEGTVSLGADHISLMGKLAPGPDYMLYLSPEFVETEADFERLKSTMQRIAPIKTFENFVVPIPEGVDLSQYNSVIVWCESFGEFITAAQYR